MTDDNIIIATRLALLFTEKSEIPTRFKKGKEGKSKINLNTQIEIRFQERVAAWDNFVSTILTKLEHLQAFRFININPIVERNIKSAAYCKDFQDFTEYFVLRRDKENCNDEEVGCLSSLHTAFQRRIDEIIMSIKTDEK